MTLVEFRAAWVRFLAMPFPAGYGSTEVNGVCLASCDSALSGCISRFHERGALDAQRVPIVTRACSDIERTLPDLAGEAHEYFSVLLTLGVELRSRTLQ